MKTVITCAILLLAALQAEGQVRVQFKRYYAFCHDTSINTVDAFNKNLDSNMGSYRMAAKFVFDAKNSTFQMTKATELYTKYEHGIIYESTSLDNIYGGKDFGFLIRHPQNSNPTTVYIFQNTPTQRLYMEAALSEKYPGKRCGIQAVMETNP